MEPKIIQQHNICYEINENELTAEVTYSPNTKGTIFFPPLIEYESHEYKITNIKEGSFKDNINIKSIEISDQSEITLFRHKLIHLKMAGAITLLS